MSRQDSDASPRPVSSRSKSVVHDPFSSSGSSRTLNGHEAVLAPPLKKPSDSPTLALEDLLKPFITIKVSLFEPMLFF